MDIQGIGLIICIIIILALVGILIGRAGRYYKYKAYNALLRKKLDDEKDMYSRLNEIYNESRILRHDVKHYLTMVLGLIINENYEEAEQLILNIIGDKFSIPIIRYMGSNLVDTILTEKNEECIKKNIVFEIIINGTFPEKFDMNIAILLANLLDNAIEYCEKTSNDRITLDMYEQKGMFYIVIKNKITESLAISNPEMKSHKKNTKYHGFGLMSVKRLTKEMDGSYQTFEENNMFVTYITIPI